MHDLLISAINLAFAATRLSKHNPTYLPTYLRIKKRGEKEKIQKNEKFLKARKSVNSISGVRFVRSDRFIFLKNYLS